MTSVPDAYGLRTATRDDIAQLQSVDLAASQLFEPTGLITEEDGPVPIPAHALNDGINNGLLFVVTDPFAEPVGFVLASQKGPDLYLDQVSVNPAHGKRGLGAILVQRIIMEADARRKRGVILSTFRDLPWNGPFYRKLGFEEIPKTRLKPWMKALEKIQSETMDVSLRCFMRRPGTWDRRWFRLPRRENRLPEQNA